MRKTKVILTLFVVLFFIGIKHVSAVSSVNSYILKNGVVPASEQINYRISMQDSVNNGGIKMDFKAGKPQLVIVHDVGVEGSKIDNEITYMVNHQEDAFVHSFVDGNQLKTIAQTNKIAWGVGPFGNRYAIQIEQLRVDNKAAFAKQITSLANWTANQMIQYDMGKPKLVSINSKSLDGNLASHENISYKWGGTNHIDPVEYWQKRGQQYFGQNYDMNQFSELVTYYYNKNSSIKTAHYQAITNQINVNYQAIINQTGRNDGLYTGGPWRTTAQSLTAKERAPRYSRQQVTVMKTAQTKGVTWSEVALTNGQTYWVDSRGLQLLDTVTNQINVNYQAIINQTGRNDGLYTGGPWRTTAQSLTAKERALRYSRQQVTVMKTAQTKGVTWSEVALTNGQTYWVDSRGLEKNDRPLNLAGVSMQQKQWIDNNLNNVKIIASQNNIFPSVMLAQAITESAWGQSELAKNANNLFGIKATSDWHGATYQVKTREVAAKNMTVVDYTGKKISVKKGNSYYIYANFRKYRAQADSLKDYTVKIRNNYPITLRASAKTYQNAFNGLQNSGYATDPHYAQNMIQRIEKYDLNVLD
ncbi:hypothetical protein FE410_04725 [Leuconostoc carnosum]|uniref:GW dipeptide domain-containing protein n=1 Tax=Leuconostoc carnosum TaxID=1252 RepID=UPI00123BBFFF|nr:GW dipeptide domain-containing protein [Leuconostoc carnosum]KAA8371000.1 hypothetical protein FE414_04720 [Leuconostoc carnosum]KAA8382644.1 hypothetical protein FE410_04725 [Leuconostoc carnosum]